MKDAAEDASKPLPVGYQSMVPHLCIFVSGTSLSKSGPAYLGIPREACVVEEKEAAAIFARWKGSYRLASIAPGPEMSGDVRRCPRVCTVFSHGVGEIIISWGPN